MSDVLRGIFDIFNIFVSDTDSGIEYTPTTCANLCGVNEALEGRDAILDSLRGGFLRTS